jgi:hypothetical protein
MVLLFIHVNFVCSKLYFFSRTLPKSLCMCFNFLQQKNLFNCAMREMFLYSAI